MVPRPITHTYTYQLISLKALADLHPDELEAVYTQSSPRQDPNESDDAIPEEELNTEEPDEPVKAPPKIYDIVSKRLNSEDPYGRFIEASFSPTKPTLQVQQTKSSEE